MERKADSIQAQPKRYNVEKAEDERYQQNLLLRCEVIVEAANRLWCKNPSLSFDRLEQLIYNQHRSNRWTLKAICETQGHCHSIEMYSQAFGQHLTSATKFPWKRGRCTMYKGVSRLKRPRSESTLEVADACSEYSFSSLDYLRW